jgi:DNA end-binding protein Ku
MATRVMWKGVLRIGDEQVPIRLHAAVESSDVQFHLLHATDGVRVKQRIVHPGTGDVVPPDQIHKGLALRDGLFVLIEPSELESLEPTPDRDVVIETFVPDDSIGGAWFERPYHLSPDGRPDAYYALAEALKRHGSQGIAHWTMRARRYAGALRAHGDHLTLITLRDREEVLEPPRRSSLPKVSASNPKELKLAQDLVSALHGELDLTAFVSHHRERVRTLVEEKAAGKRPRLAVAKTRAATEGSLQRALAASLKQLRPMRATRPGRTKEQKSA